MNGEQTGASPAKKPVYKKWWFWVIVILIVAAVGGGAASERDSGTEKPNSASVAESTTAGSDDSTTGMEHDGIWHNDKFTLLEADTLADKSSQFAYYIGGRLRNDRDRDLSYVQIKFLAYDAEGNTIATCFDNQSGLPANGTWKFEAMCTVGNDKVDHWEFSEVSSW